MLAEMHLFDLKIIKQPTEREHFHQDIEIIFAMEGNIEVKVVDEKFRMEKNDILIVNSNRRHMVTALSDGSVTCFIHMNHNMLSKILKTNLFVFFCNSTLESSAKYEKFRHIIGELLSEYYIEPEEMSLMKLSNFYKLAHYMVKYFIAVKESITEGEKGKRTEQVLQYINQNYNNKLTLQEMAELIYVSPTSFSRFFKKAVGLTFIEYVNNVRLHYAIEDLLYTDKSLTRIAEDNGFSNVSAFNKVFKKVYAMSPTRFKEKKFCEERMEQSGNGLKDYLETYRQETKITVVKEQQVQIRQVEIQTDQYEPYENPWTKALNLGRCSNLLSSECQKQIIFMKKDLRFEYGRIWNVFSSDMKCRRGHEKNIIHYNLLDNVFDFMVENRIKPMICLDAKPIAAIKEVNEYVYSQEPEQLFDDMEECLAVLEEFLKHIVYRYGMMEVDNWYFEVWYDEDKKTTLGIPGDFVEQYSAIKKCIKSCLKEAKVGGCGLSMGILEKPFQDIFPKWKECGEWPDFISIYVYPYQRKNDMGKMHTVRKSGVEFFREELIKTKSILKKIGWGDIPLYITEWNISFTNRNFFNDSCAKGAMMLHQMISEMQEVEFGSYWYASDLYSEYYDSNQVINGADGLLTSAGICKPAFYALNFIELLEKNIVASGQGYIVTTNGNGLFTVILYNDKKFGYNYYSRKEFEIGLEEIEKIFEDQDDLELLLTLRNVENGHYYVRKSGISPQRGSIIHEWKKLGMNSAKAIGDIEYLKHFCVPHRENEEITVRDNKLVIKQRLSAHEFIIMQILK